MKRLLSVFWVTLIVGVTLAQAGGKLQNEDFKSVADLIAAGSDQSHLLNDTKIYITANGLNQQLSTAISAGLIGGSSGGGGGIQLLANPGAEVDVNHITDTIPADLTRTTVSANVLFGQGSFSLLASAAETVTWDAVTIPTGLYGQSCAASLVYKGNAVGYTMRVEDGSSNILASQALSNQSSPTTQLLSFICPGSGTMKLQIVTTGSAAQIYFDNAILGTSPLTSQVNQAYLVGTVQIPGAASCSWAISAEAPGSWENFPTNGSCATPVVTGALQAASTNIPGFQAALPQGHYLILVTGEMNNGSTGGFHATSIYNGTDRSLDTPTSMDPGTGPNYIGQGTHAFNMVVTNSALLTYQIQAQALAATATAEINNELITGMNLTFSVYRYPTQSETVFNPAMTANSWTGYHDNTCSFNVTSTSLAEFTNSSACGFFQRTNANFGTVVSYNDGGGHNLPGIVFTPSRLGKYFICADTKWNVASSSSATLEISDLSNTFVGGLFEGVPTAIASTVIDDNICGMYNAINLNPITLRFRGSASAGAIVIGGDAPESTIDWSIFQVDQQFPMPLLVNSVVSDSQGVEKIERAKIATCTTDPCTIISQSGNWVTAVNRTALGNYTIHMAAGTFKEIPTCTFFVGDNTSSITGAADEFNTNTPTSIQVTTGNPNGTIIDYSFYLNVICMGPH